MNISTDSSSTIEYTEIEIQTNPKTCDICGFPIVGEAYEVSWKKSYTETHYTHSDQARCHEIKKLRRQLVELRSSGASDK